MSDIVEIEAAGAARGVAQSLALREVTHHQPEVFTPRGFGTHRPRECSLDGTLAGERPRQPELGFRGGRMRSAEHPLADGQRLFVIGARRVHVPSSRLQIRVQGVDGGHVRRVGDPELLPDPDRTGCQSLRTR